MDSRVNNCQLPVISDERIKIAHVIPEDGLGGVEVAARSMAARADPAVFRLIPIAGGTALPDLKCVSRTRYASPNDPRAHFDALHRIHEFAPNLLICSMWRSVAVGLLAKWLQPKLKLVMFLHIARPAHLVDWLLHALAMRLSDSVWFDCKATYTGRIGTVRKPTRVISFVTGDLQQAAEPAPAPSPRFVSWCRLHHQKGVDRAIRLLAELVRQGADASLDAYGQDNHELSSLVELANELGIMARVHFRGPVSRVQLPEIASRASFYLQLSRYEGMGMSVVEAMQLGCVPVVTPAGQIASHCRAGVNAVVVDVDDFPGAAREIIGLLNDHARYAKLRSNAMAEWSSAPLYGDDVAVAAAELMQATSPDNTRPATRQLG